MALLPLLAAFALMQTAAQPEQDPAPWLDRGASWVLTRVGPYDLDLDDVQRLVGAGPNT